MPLSATLTKLLNEHNIAAEIQTYMSGTLNIQSCDDFATYIDSRSEVQAKILDHVGTHRTDAQSQYRLKQAWRVANDDYERRRARAKQGWAEEEIDSPLSPEDMAMAHTNFKTQYKFHFRSFDTCADVLFGRIYREGQRWSMTFVKVEKIKDLKHSQMVPQAKKARIADELYLTTGKEIESVTIPTPMHYLHGLRVYCNMLAVSGVHTVVSNHAKNPDGTAKEVLYAPLEDCLHYISHVEEKTMQYVQKCPNASNAQTLGWVRGADEATRTRVMELVRSDPKRTVGEALSMALQECGHEWAPPAAASSRDGQGLRPVVPFGGGDAKGTKGDRSPKGGGKGGKQPWQPSNYQSTSGWQRQEDKNKWSAQAQKTGQHFQGKEICKKRNDTRGCSSPCPDSKLHVCDALKKDGSVCGRTDHYRWNHRE